MKEYQALDLRNVAVVGHGGEGKTSLTEAMLFSAKHIDRLGRVDEGTTTTDYDPEENKRTISISAAIAPIEWKNKKINIIDVPGYFDFVGEVVGALRVADAALIVLSGVSGVAVGTEKAWEYADDNGISKMFFVNQMDRENANFSKVVDQLRQNFGSSILPIQIPIMDGQLFKGLVNVVSGKAILFDGKQVKEIPVPENLKDEVASQYALLEEAAAGTDEELMTKYFDEGKLSTEDVMKGFAFGVQEGSIVPVLCGSAIANVGVDMLMDMMCEFLPSPTSHIAKGMNPKTNTEDKRNAADTEPFSSLVFKTVADPFVGKLSLFRIYSGVLTSDMTLYNANMDKNEKVGTIYLMRGKKQIQVDKLHAGDIGAIAKLQYTVTGHTLCDTAKPIIFPSIDFPKPCISLAASAKNQKEEEKVFAGLRRLEEEDPTFKVEKSMETKETLLSGLGELHLEVLCKKLLNKFGVEAVLSDPKIPYRETIRKAVQAEGKHKKQSGGHGQYGHCWVKFEPILDPGVDFEFVDKVVGGVVPRNYIPAVEKGLRESLSKGVLAGCHVVGIRATLYDGSFHAVDSSEMAFKIAAHVAFKKGCEMATPVLLEPIYRVEVTVPDDYTGDIIGDINRRRGRMGGMNPGPKPGTQVIVADIPMAEMFKYATDLRSMTQSRGSFKTAFERYEDVPAHISAKVIEQAKKDMSDDEE